MENEINHVVRTPIDTLNILGAGGVRAGTILQAYGPPATGKSTFCYQTAALYQKDNPEAVVHIIDVENSVDLIRLEHVFKLDMDRVKIHNLQSLEDAFSLIIKIGEMMNKQIAGKMPTGNGKMRSRDELLKMDDKDFWAYVGKFSPLSMEEKPPAIVKTRYNDDRVKAMKALGLAGGYRIPEYGNMIPTLVIWDTIAVSRPKLDFENAKKGEAGVNAGGMNLSTRVISQNLSSVLAIMGGKVLTLFLPNQVRLKGFSGHGGPQESFYGSYALEHNCHYILKFNKIGGAGVINRNYDKEISMRTGTEFRMNIEKTKFCPVVHKIHLYINSQLGGIIVPGEEVAYLAKDLGILVPSNKEKLLEGTEITIPSLPDLGVFKWYRDQAKKGENYVANNVELRKILLEEITRHYRKSFFTLDYYYNDVGLGDYGKPSKEDAVTKQTIEDQEILQAIQDTPFGS